MLTRGFDIRGEYDLKNDGSMFLRRIIMKIISFIHILEPPVWAVDMSAKFPFFFFFSNFSSLSFIGDVKYINNTNTQPSDTLFFQISSLILIQYYICKYQFKCNIIIVKKKYISANFYCYYFFILSYDPIR